ncbi:MAG: NADP-dependent oxidoreductase, partial [Pseudomonadota bacterium]
MAQDNRVWTLANRPQGDLRPGDLKLETRPMPTPADGEILVQTIYLSLDPTNRVWMNEAKSYLPPVGVGDMMRGLSLGRVVSSKADGFAEGDIVIPSMGGWADYITA